MTAISINRIGEPVPSQSIKVQAQPEAIVAPDCVPRNAMRPPPGRTARLGTAKSRKQTPRKPNASEHKSRSRRIVMDCEFRSSLVIVANYR